MRADRASSTVHDLWVGEVSGPVDDFVVMRNDGVPAYNLAVVYDDVPAKLHAMARRSLLAHLHKLRDDGRITQPDADRWALAAG